MRCSAFVAAFSIPNNRRYSHESNETWDIYFQITTKDYSAITANSLSMRLENRFQALCFDFKFWLKVRPEGAKTKSPTEFRPGEVLAPGALAPVRAIWGDFEAVGREVTASGRLLNGARMRW